jgi:hypothetical protein
LTSFKTIALTLCLTAMSPAGETSSGSQQDHTIEKAFISFRISPMQWMPENRYKELLTLFEKHKGVTDEITFFSSFTHPPLPLDEVKHRCNILARRIPQAKSLGYRAGINILSTIGHHEENLPNSLSGDYTPMTDINGKICRGSLCPNDPRFQEYVRKLYQLVADADPDYIWLDDDIRLAGHMPIGHTCFCDNCLSIFEKESGTKYTRDSLQTALCSGSREQRVAISKAWLAHNRATIERLLSLIERTVHQRKPGMPLGFMTGDRFYEGYDFDQWAKSLAGPKNTPVYWRPGGGFYEDTATNGLVGKSHDIGRQVSMLPPSVLSIQSEIENFPYQRLQKAASITVLEAASHIGAGCTGAAFNVLSGNNEPLDEFEPLVARLRHARPFFDMMAKHIGRAQPVGVRTAWDKDSAAAGDMFSGASFVFQPSEVFEIGISAAYGPQGAAVTLLFPQSLATMSKVEITKVLSTGVYTDPATLDALNQMGFQELTGLAIDQCLPNDCIEELTDHPLNGPLAGRPRDCRQSFNHLAAYGLKKVDLKAETLSRLVNYAGKETAATSMAVFENRLGGRVCVGGYFPWTYLHTLSKSNQMKSVMRWLSRDRLPAYVASYHKVNLWTRQPDDGCLAIALVNASFDPADDLVLALLTQSDQIKVFDMDCREHVVRAGGRDGPYRHFTLLPIEPWSARLVVQERPVP